MPEWIGIPELVVHFSDPLGIGDKETSQLVTVFILSFTVIFQCVQIRVVDQLVGEVSFKETSCFYLNSIWVISTAPDFKSCPSSIKHNKQCILEQSDKS